MARYLDLPADDVTLVVTHSGAPRGKRAIDALVKVKARVVECPAIKTDRDKTDLVDARSAGRAARPPPKAFEPSSRPSGATPASFASAVAQLVEDTEGVVDDRVVEIYHGGKVEATGFRVADAAVAGQTGEALRLLRHAIATGVDPVPIVAVLASQRQLVKVGSAGRGGSRRTAGRADWVGALAGRQGPPPARSIGRPTGSAAPSRRSPRRTSRSRAADATRSSPSSAPSCR